MRRKVDKRPVMLHFHNNGHSLEVWCGRRCAGKLDNGRVVGDVSQVLGDDRITTSRRRGRAPCVGSGTAVHARLIRDIGP